MGSTWYEAGSREPLEPPPEHDIVNWILTGLILLGLLVLVLLNWNWSG